MVAGGYRGDVVGLLLLTEGNCVSDRSKSNDAFGIMLETALSMNWIKESDGEQRRTRDWGYGRALFFGFCRIRKELKDFHVNSLALSPWRVGSIGTILIVEFTPV